MSGIDTPDPKAHLRHSEHILGSLSEDTSCHVILGQGLLKKPDMTGSILIPNRMQYSCDA